MSTVGARAIENQGLVEMQRIILEPEQELCKDAAEFGGWLMKGNQPFKKNNPKSSTV